MVNNFTFFLLLLVFAGQPVLYSADGVCQKCIRIREDNKKKTNPYEYYEDYIKAQKGGAAAEVTDAEEDKAQKKK